MISWNATWFSLSLCPSSWIRYRLQGSSGTFLLVAGTTRRHRGLATACSHEDDIYIYRCLTSKESLYFLPDFMVGTQMSFFHWNWMILLASFCSPPVLRSSIGTLSTGAWHHCTNSFSNLPAKKIQPLKAGFFGIHVSVKRSLWLGAIACDHIGPVAKLLKVGILAVPGTKKTDRETGKALLATWKRKKAEGNSWLFGPRSWKKW